MAFYIIKQKQESNYEIKKSRFIASIMPCETEQKAMQHLQLLANQHPNANHLAFAWRIRRNDGSIIERCHDAGEPSGTAGRPILAPLEGQSIINTVIGVIRYFGGVKLGKGGLTRAYGTAAKLAIKQADLYPWVDMIDVQLTIDYSELQPLQYHLKQCDGTISHQVFNERVDLTVHLPAKQKEQLLHKFTQTGNNIT